MPSEVRQPKLKVIRNRLAAISRNDFAIGTGVVVSCLIVAAAIGIYYVAPTGTRTISFLTTDASSISVGQDVRVAGLSVGKVTEVELGAEPVKGRPGRRHPARSCRRRRHRRRGVRRCFSRAGRRSRNPVPVPRR